jgi:hypothetical protein
MSKLMVGLGCLAALVGCGGSANHPTGGAGTGGGSGAGGSGARCVPGDSKSCTGPGPCAGYQVCQADGTYGACNCASGGTGGSVGGTGGTAGSGGRGGGGGSAAGTGGRGGTGGAVTCVGAAGGGATAGASASGGGAGGADMPDAGSDRYVSDGPSSRAPFQSFCAAVRSSMIARNERCNGFTHDQALAFVNIDPCDVWGSAIDGGRMSFDATGADSCVAALNALSCAVDAPPAACDGVLIGLVPNYTGLGGPGACDYSSQLTLTGPTTPATASLFTECVPGSFCVDHSTGPGPGSICAPLLALGGTCSGAPGQGRCGAGVCDHTGHCATPKASGEGCTASSDCAPGLACGAASTCAAKHASGACASSTECIPPATCDNGNCGIRPPGGCCTSDSNCAVNQACPTGGGSCYVMPVLGQACELGRTVCLAGVCDGTTKVCRPPTAGSFCAADSWCGPDAICFPFAGSYNCSSPTF